MRRRAIGTVAALCALVPLTAYAEENAPPLPGPDLAVVTAGQTVDIPVLANDVDDGLTGPLQVVGVVRDGRATYDQDSVQFTAGAGDSGVVTFGYDVSDGELVTTGTVTVTITPVAPPTVSLTVPDELVALRTWTMSGRLSPAQPGQVLLQRKVGRSPWTTVLVATADDTGAFTFAQQLTRVGRVSYRAGRDSLWSPVLTRTVTARADVQLSGPLSAKDVPWSWRPGCPVSPGDLRRIEVNHVTYDQRVRRGSVVVAARSVPAVRTMFERALAKQFPFKRLRPADHFYADGRRTPTGSDLAAMAADNTSAFNCRSVTGNPYRLSQHSYGSAIDINTVRNPYVTASRVYPSFARPYLDRGHRRDGMLFHDGIVNKTLRAAGWHWGARWAHPDYQHFSSNGG